MDHNTNERKSFIRTVPKEGLLADIRGLAAAAWGWLMAPKERREEDEPHRLVQIAMGGVVLLLLWIIFAIPASYVG